MDEEWKENWDDMQVDECQCRTSSDFGLRLRSLLMQLLSNNNNCLPLPMHVYEHYN